MAAAAPTYDLVLLLDPQAEEPARTKIVSDTKAAIAAHGEVTRHDEWGERALAYPIEHRATAEYHLLQFHAAQTSLIADLNRVLHITDGVIRFRINKLRPGTPEAPDLKADRGGATPPAERSGGASPADREGAGGRGAEEPAAA
ncbi:MAG TPA: 30S ribosomal protein S6 [Solirubrobacteraceae bacterium]|jgi:small subunit ribosomal protein S6|nr:30S ribosomal protein S6 [Solirubrobacteraceae bacterium]